MTREELIDIISKDENTKKVSKEKGCIMMDNCILTVRDTDLRVEAFGCGLTMLVPLEDLYVEENCPTCHMDGVPDWVTVRSKNGNLDFTFTK